MTGVNGGVVLGNVGMDGLSKKIMETAANEAKAKIMVRGRQCYIVIVASDGPNAALVRCPQVRDAATALGYAEALEAEARRIREHVKAKALGAMGSA